VDGDTAAEVFATFDEDAPNYSDLEEVTLLPGGILNYPGEWNQKSSDGTPLGAGPYKVEALLPYCTYKEGVQSVCPATTWADFNIGTAEN
jgi:hypothetical protein